MLIFKNLNISKLKKISRTSNYLTEERDNKRYRLDKNENTHNQLFIFLKELFNKINPNDINSYPNFKKLYSIISKEEKINKNQILLTSGADAAIKLIFETLIKKNDKIIITEPSFAMYDIYSKLFQSVCIKLIYKRKNNRFVFDTDYLKKKITQENIKVIFLPNPDSPTGHVFDRSEIKKLIHLCYKKFVFLVIDEAYYPFYNMSSVSLIDKYNNLIIIRTGSKSFGLAGLRVGFIASNSKIISMISKYRPIYEISSLSSKFYSHLYKNIKKVKKITEELVNIKKNFEEFLKKLNFDVIETHANFVLVNLGNKKISVEKKLKKLAYIKNNVYIDKKKYSRITITNKNKIEKIKKIFKNVK